MHSKLLVSAFVLASLFGDHDRLCSDPARSGRVKRGQRRTRCLEIRNEI
jgi:hypothetical protein